MKSLLFVTTPRCGVSLLPKAHLSCALSSLATASALALSVLTCTPAHADIPPPTFLSYQVGAGVDHLLMTDLVLNDVYTTNLIMNNQYQVSGDRLLSGGQGCQINHVFDGHGDADGNKDIDTAAKLKTQFSKFSYYQYQNSDVRGGTKRFTTYGAIDSWSYTN